MSDTRPNRQQILELTGGFRAAGFENPRLALKHETMNSLVTTERP